MHRLNVLNILNILGCSVTGIGTTGKTLDPEKGSIVKADFEKAIELTGNFVISFLSLYYDTYIRIYLILFRLWQISLLPPHGVRLRQHQRRDGRNLYVLHST